MPHANPHSSPPHPDAATPTISVRTDMPCEDAAKLREAANPLADAVALRAANLFETRQLLCAEAVLRALAEAFGGPLTPEQAAALGTPFCQGMGGAGCTCGALSGAVAGAGLFLGRPCDGASGAAGRAHARLMHDRFRKDFGATCCRVLTRGLDSAAHFAQCQKLTREAARMVAVLLLDHGIRPAEECGLPKVPDTRLTTWKNRLRALFRPRRA